LREERTTSQRGTHVAEHHQHRPRRALVQFAPSRISAAAELQIEPTLGINGFPYFAESDVEKIAAHLRGRIADGNALAARANHLS